MTSLDHMTSAFECLWEAKVYLSKCADKLDDSTKLRVLALLDETAATRDKLQSELIELMGKFEAGSRLQKG